PRPDRQVDTVQHVHLVVALPVVTLDVVQRQDRPRLVRFIRLGAFLENGVTHTRAPPPDRGARPARTDRASPAATASAPSPPPPPSRRCPFRPADETGNRVRGRTARCR